MEPDLIPYEAVSCLSAKSVLVLAPHPDDEVFGCGGAVAIHVGSGIRVHVVVLTDGALYGDPAVRERESIAAARVLGYGEPEFWRECDGALACSDALVQRLANRINVMAVDLLYAPSPWELHPDHRQAFALAFNALMLIGSGVRLALYEVGAPLRPNVLLDISLVYAIKEAAMRCFVSQIEKQNYVAHVQALNCYRTYTLPSMVTSAEAFCLMTMDALKRMAPGSSLGLTLPHRIVCHGSKTQDGFFFCTDAAAPQSRPMVSVLIRTIGRWSLLDAIASVECQEQPNLEIVVLNAGGVPLGPLGNTLDKRVTRVVEPGKPLQRSAAANALLDSAQGQFALFLDDDDVLLPGHLTKLLRVLHASPELVACYSDVQLLNLGTAEGGVLEGHVFQQPFDRTLLQFQNYLPIHSVLFRLDCVRHPPVCRFSEDLVLFEDWDFWLQLAAKGNFTRVPGVTALYMLNAKAGSGHAEPDGVLRQLMMQHLGRRQLERWSGSDYVSMASWHTQNATDKRQAEQALGSAKLELDSAKLELDSVKLELNGAKVAADLARLHQIELEHQIALIYRSRSWLWTQPLRSIHRLLQWLIKHSSRRTLQNGLRAAKSEIQRHSMAGFLHRLPHYWHHRVAYFAVLASAAPAKQTIFAVDSPIALTHRRLHPDLVPGDKWIDRSVSVVIPTLNAGTEWTWLLRRLSTQKGLRHLEIVIVDSGSQDATVMLARDAGCRVVQIAPTEFSHSHARNLGAAEATGEYLLFMVQDAYPIGDYWVYGMLQFLLDHTADGLVAASCSEYSRSDSDIMYDAMIDTHYRFLGCHAQDRIGSLTGTTHMALRSQGQLSDVACMISSATFGQYRYRGDYAEDLDLGIRLIMDGHRVAMLASVKVIHSHNRPPIYYLKRSYVDVIFLVGMFDDFLIPVLDSIEGLLVGMVSCAGHVSAQLPRLATSAPDETLAQCLGLWIKRCRQQCKEIRFDMVCALDDPQLDTFVNEWGRRVASLSMDEATQIEAQRFMDSFLARLGQLGTFIGTVYGDSDAKLLGGLQDAIRKSFAATAGSMLGFAYMQGVRNQQTPSAWIDAIDNELRRGV